MPPRTIPQVASHGRPLEARRLARSRAITPDHHLLPPRPPPAGELLRPAPRRVLQLHALLLTSGALSLSHPSRAATAFPYNCLIHAHLRLRGSPSSPPWGPLRIFSSMLARGVRPNRRTFPSLLKSTAGVGASAAATAAALHLRRGLEEDRFAACSLLVAYGREGSLVRDARKVFDGMCSPDLASYNAMLDVLCLSGDMYAACCLFDRMMVRDVVSWMTIISGLTSNGCHWDAIEMFRGFLLRNKGRLPKATLVSVLSACANLDAAEGLVAGMAVHGYVVRHGVQFTAFLGTAFIDMYGKYGKLTCCSHKPKVHGNIELSAQIREKLIALGPQQPGRYVTVRNMYLEEGNWHAATRMGEVMQEAGIKNIGGLSSVVLYSLT